MKKIKIDKNFIYFSERFCRGNNEKDLKITSVFKQIKDTGIYESKHLDKNGSGQILGHSCTSAIHNFMDDNNRIPNCIHHLLSNMEINYDNLKKGFLYLSDADFLLWKRFKITNSINKKVISGSKSILRHTLNEIKSENLLINTREQNIDRKRLPGVSIAGNNAACSIIDTGGQVIALQNGKFTWRDFFDENLYVLPKKLVEANIDSFILNKISGIELYLDKNPKIKEEIKDDIFDKLGFDSTGLPFL
jgi:hypothetical protein